jgi:dimeric dUTPase (all-alpha-NTP-PPase superfamily)
MEVILIIILCYIQRFSLSRTKNILTCVHTSQYFLATLEKVQLIAFSITKSYHHENKINHKTKTIFEF